MTRLRRFLLASLLAVGVGMVLACGGSSESADSLWDRGDKAGAVRKYKEDFDGWLTTSSEREKMLPRIVEVEMKAGNKDEAKAWIKRGVEKNLKVEYTDPAAKELLAAAQKEHAEDLARREAELKQKAEEEAKQRAIEDAKPKPSRANYNKVQNGMSLDQVQAILGPGKESLSGPGLQYVNWQSTPGFGEQQTIIVVGFENNRVITKTIAGP